MGGRVTCYMYYRTKNTPIYLGYETVIAELVPYVQTWGDDYELLRRIAHLQQACDYCCSLRVA